MLSCAGAPLTRPQDMLEEGRQPVWKLHVLGELHGAAFHILRVSVAVVVFLRWVAVGL